jgi:hypothetical protein
MNQFKQWSDFTAQEKLSSIIELLQADNKPIVVDLLKNFDKRLFAPSDKYHNLKYLSHNDLERYFNFEVMGTRFNIRQDSFMDQLFTYSHEKRFLFWLEVAFYRLYAKTYLRTKINPITRIFQFVQIKFWLNTKLFKKFWPLLLILTQVSLVMAVLVFMFLQAFGIVGMPATIIVVLITLFVYLRTTNSLH